MKHSTRLLSVLLAFLFVFNIIMPSAKALKEPNRDSKGNIALTAEESAKLILDYADALLEKEGDVLDIDIVKIDYRSVDKALADIYKVITNNKLLLIGFGDLAKINVTAFKGVQRKGGDLKVINALIQFLKDNEATIKKLAKGEKLTFGPLVDAIIKDEIKFDIPDMLLDTIYDELVKEKDGPKRADSAYKSSTADALLNVALQNMLKKEFDFFDEALLAKADINKLTVFTLFENFAGVFFENLALDPLNKDLKMILANLSGASYDKANNKVTKTEDTTAFYDVINWNYAFDKNSYDFNAGFAKYNGGIVEQINDIAYAVLKAVLTDDAFNQIGLESGGNDKLNANIDKLVRFALPLFPADFFHDGFDPASLTAEEIGEMSLEHIAALVLRAVVESSPDIVKTLLSLIEMFGIDVGNIEFPEDIKFFPEDVEIDTLEKLAAYTLRGLASEVLVDDFVELYDEALEDADDAAMADLSLDIFMDILIHFADEFLPLDLGTEEVLKLKTEKGWKADHFIDEIIDWILGYTNGIFAVTDKFPAASIKRGEMDASFGPWTKINMLVNAILPLEFLNGKTFEKDGVKGIDIEDLVKDKLLANFFKLDVASMTNIIADNNNSGNLLKVNIAEALLKLVQKVLNSVLPGTINDANTKSFAALLNHTNLSNMVGRLITALNSRKAKLIPAVLPIVATLMYDEFTYTPLALENPLVVKSGKQTDLRIVSVISQKEAKNLFGLPREEVASGAVKAVDKKEILEVGTLIVPKAYAVSKGWEKLDLSITDNKVKKVVSDHIYNNNANKDGSGYYYFAAKIQGIKASQADEIYAVGYIKYKVDKTTFVVYTKGQTYVLADFLG